MTYKNAVAGAAREALNAVDLSSTEVGLLDTATAGAAVAGKVLATDASNKVSGQRTASAAKTSAYTITAADSGKILTNRGASGSVTFTLPTVAAGFDGVDVTIMAVVAAQNVVIAAQTAGQIITFNDAAADSITISTASEIIGAAVRCVCDGTSWLCILLVNESTTVTIA